VGVKCKCTRGCASRNAATSLVLCADSLSTITSLAVEKIPAQTSGIAALRIVRTGTPISKRNCSVVAAGDEHRGVLVHGGSGSDFLLISPAPIEYRFVDNESVRSVPAGSLHTKTTDICHLLIQLKVHGDLHIGIVQKECQRTASPAKAREGLGGAWCESSARDLFLRRCVWPLEPALHLGHLPFASLDAVLDFAKRSRHEKNLRARTAVRWNFGLCATIPRKPRQARKGATVAGQFRVPRSTRSSSHRSRGRLARERFI
jgi:hypothetical protein